MMKAFRKQCLAGWMLAFAGGAWAMDEAAPVEPFEREDFVVSESRIDRLAFGAMKKAGIEPALPCSDAVFVRRAFLDVTGALPSAMEVNEFLKDRSSDKRARLIDQLLERDEYVDYWTMKWCDVLRVKSEFPINLWPDAVQAYHRWIREALRSDMPYDEMARALLTSSGSNFRVPPVNFYRAIQGKGPEPVSAAVALTFMGSRIETWPEENRAGMHTLFSRVAFKPTAEWKEEIVCLDPSEFGPLDAMFPDGSPARVAPGGDPRAVFADWLLKPGNRWFARAAANRTWAWVFGRGIVNEPDDLRPDNPPSIPGLLEYLAGEFRENGYNQKKLLRRILNSRVYQLSPLPRGDDPKAAALFASYPVRRLEAEVLLDALCSLTGTKEGYMSPIPEPFTHIPKTSRSVNLADGSITSPFLEMFGRSSRDTGLVLERNNRMSASQRLHLLNSSDIQRKIERGWKLRNVRKSRRNNPVFVVRVIYASILSRPPTRAELRILFDDDDDDDDEQGGKRYGAKATGKQATDDLVWALINSKEFLHRH